MAVVDTNGLVTAKSPGTATITVETLDGHHKASLNTTVNSKNNGGTGETGGTNESSENSSTSGNEDISPKSNPNVPEVETSNNNGNIISVTPVINNDGYAIASITQQHVNEAIKSAQKTVESGKSNLLDVVIQISPAAHSQSIELKLNQSSIKALSESKINGLVLSTSLATVTLDRKAINSGPMVIPA